jgi:hypothetical protein
VKSGNLVIIFDFNVICMFSKIFVRHFILANLCEGVSEDIGIRQGGWNLSVTGQVGSGQAMSIKRYMARRLSSCLLVKSRLNEGLAGHGRAN